MPTPAETVTKFFAHFRTSEIDKAFACWAPGARWTILGASSRARDYALADYLELCGAWRAAYPNYVATFGDVQEAGEIAYFAIRSENGEAPGIAEGLMMYRVVDGRITEGWALPTSHGGQYAF